MGFPWSWNNSKSPQVSRTLLNILSDVNDTVVWMVSSPCTNPLVIVSNTPVIIGITNIFMLHVFFFSSLARSRYLSVFRFHSISPCGQPVVTLFLLLTITRSYRLTEFIIIIICSSSSSCHNNDRLIYLKLIIPCFSISQCYFLRAFFLNVAHVFKKLLRDTSNRSLLFRHVLE